VESKPFHFKYFSVAQDRCIHKVGTDGVLLGAWVKLTGTDNRILDIGTGSGLIALMIAQRSTAGTRIDAVDIAPTDIQQAMENVSRSPWPEKISVHHTAVQDFFPPNRYDLIISNPPYFERSLLPPDNLRTLARHTQNLSFPDLLSNASRLLAEKGRLAVILPYNEGLKVIDVARNEGLHASRKTGFRSRAEKPVERLLIEFSREKHDAEKSDLVLYDKGNAWSQDYKMLTREFYLKI
jgi:tRNA1Val (adenine37-N6)-methyltransferase